MGSTSQTDCGPLLAPRTSCSVFLTFTPTQPGTRNGTLSIASDDPSNPLYSVPISGTGYTTAPVPEISSLSLPAVPAGYGAATIVVDGYGFQPNSVVRVSGKPQQTIFRADMHLQFVLDPALISAGTRGELPVTVFTPTPGGGESTPYPLLVFQSIQARAADILYEPVHQALFASLAAGDVSNPNAVVERIWGLNEDLR